MGTPQKTICLVADDMFFSSKVESASKKLGAALIKAKSLEELRSRTEGKTIDLVIIDLASKRIDAEEIFAGLKSSSEHEKTFCIGYLPHVERELAAKFRGKGMDLVVPRSRFSRDMTAIIQEYSRREESGGPARGQS